MQYFKIRAVYSRWGKRRALWAVCIRTYEGKSGEVSIAGFPESIEVGDRGKLTVVLCPRRLLITSILVSADVEVVLLSSGSSLDLARESIDGLVS